MLREDNEVVVASAVAEIEGALIASVENLRMIRRDGMDAFLEYERQHWTCPNCGRPFSVHDRNCPHCGKSVIGADA